MSVLPDSNIAIRMSESQSTGKKTTRLMITKMILENFKSYAGVQNIGPFHKRFSSIVGPNGSGKSNVIDALLFVFGKRAKQLRLNKVSELIHKSSAYPDLDYANVEVHFQLIVDDEEDDDGYEVVPGSDFVVSRTAYRNNTSKYAVDSKTSNFNDVGVLLRSHGIDLDNNRFLILQGEVEQIAMMKPKGVTNANGTSTEDGLLEYLEDIIGSNRHIEQIEAWSKSLDELNEKRIEKVNRMKIAERDRDNLSGSRQEAEEYLEKERDIRRKQNMLYQLFIYEALHITQEATEKKTKGIEKLANEKKKRVENDAKLAECEKEYEVIRAKYDKICEDLNNATNDFSSFERRDIKLEEDKKHLSKQIKKLEATIAKESKKESDCSKEFDKLSKEMEFLTQKISELETQKAVEDTKLEEIMSTLEASTTEIREVVEKKQVELGAAEKIVSQLQTEKEMLNTSLSIVMSRTENQKKQLHECQEKKASIETSLDEIKNVKLATATKQKEEATAQRSSLEKKIAKNVSEEPSLLQSLHTTLQKVEEGKLSLQMSQSQKKNANGHSPIVAALLKAAKVGGPLSGAGVRGRLGDLACISPEFDVAISTACGGMLEYIVVETVEGGQACLEFIRRNKLGRISLIVLDQMEAHKKNMQRPFQAPANSNRLFDLIQLVDQNSTELLPAFFCALGNTLVTGTLDGAVKLAYDSGKSSRALYRVVAKDGNLIETSGAMSGGGKVTKSGSMKLTSKNSSKQSMNSESVSSMTPQELMAMEDKAKQLQSLLSDHRNCKVALDRELKECIATIKRLDTDLEMYKMQLKRLNEQQLENNKKLATCSKENKMDEQETIEMNKLQGQISALDVKINETSPNLVALQTEVANLQKQILDVGGPKLKRTQLRISEYAQQLDELNCVLSGKEVEAAEQKKQSQKSSKMVEKANVEIEEVNEKINALLEERKEMETDAMNLIKALESAKQLKKSQEEYLRNAKVSYDELVVLVNTVKTVEIDLQTQIENCTKIIKENTDISSHWKKKLDEVRRLHIEEKNEMKTLLKSFEMTGASAHGKSVEIIKSTTGEEASGNGSDESEEEHRDIRLYVHDDLTKLFGGIEEAVEDDDNMEVDNSTTPLVVVKTTATVLNKMKSRREEIKHDINTLEVERDKLKSNVNMGALMEYLRKDADYRVRLVELEEITSERNTIRKSYEECRRKRLEEFMSGFGIITLKLKEMYQMITLGGDAELELVDSLDPFSEGIVFSVRPPKKSWKNISNLSGGEKTLSSLALVFALHHFKPTPLYVMDEIDAALDFKNVSIVANYIKERTKNAQFVIISLRNNMFELADRLVGIYKTYDCTKSVTINPKLFTNCGGIEVNDGGSNNAGQLHELHQKVVKKTKNVLENKENTQNVE